MRHGAQARDRVRATTRRGAGMSDGAVVAGWMRTVCRGRDGRVKWVDEGWNLITDEGLDWILTGDVTSGLHVGIADNAGNAQGTWGMGDLSEVTAYTEAARPSYQSSVASQTATNDGNEAAFSVDTDGTSYDGAFIATDDTKGGTGGTLIAVRQRGGGSRTLDDGDTLEIQYDLSLSRPS